jgi:hypothetical protein
MLPCVPWPTTRRRWLSTARTATAKITVLLTAEEIDAAMKKSAAYRSPGQ